MSSKVQPPPIPLSDAVKAILATATRRARRVLKQADTAGPLALHGHSTRFRVGDVDVRLDVTVRGADCDYPVPAFETPKVWGSAPVPTPDTAACGSVRPGCWCGQPINPARLPCVLPAGHDDRHTDAFGATWPDEAFPVAPANPLAVGSRQDPSGGADPGVDLAVHARIARHVLDDIKATQIGTAAWSTLLYERGALVSALSVLLDAIDEAQA